MAGKTERYLREMIDEINHTLKDELRGQLTLERVRPKIYKIIYTPDDYYIEEEALTTGLTSGEAYNFLLGMKTIMQLTGCHFLDE